MLGALWPPRPSTRAGTMRIAEWTMRGGENSAG